MKIKAITFDCAGTLVGVNYDPTRLAIDSAHDCGLNFDEAEAGTIYSRLIQTRWLHYVSLNHTGTEDDCDSFWREITEDWLEHLAIDKRYAAPIVEAAHLRLYGPGSTIFTLYEDTLPCLQSALKAGFRIGVLSNWDYSLPRVLKSLGVFDLFEVVIASLVKGVEKPDPRLFKIAARSLSLEPGEIVHVGDCPNDDVSGALQSGFASVHIDRGQDHPRPGQINTLANLMDAIGGLECS